MQAAARGGDNEQAGSRHDELPGLQHHWQELQDGSKVEFAQMGAMAHKLLCVAAPEAAEAVGPRDLALLIARFGCNSHTIRCVGPCACGACQPGSAGRQGVEPTRVCMQLPIPSTSPAASHSAGASLPCPYLVPLPPPLLAAAATTSCSRWRWESSL
jgi:hypothetical protein